jgi:hypothetical protein
VGHELAVLEASTAIGWRPACVALRMMTLLNAPKWRYALEVCQAVVLRLGAAVGDFTCAILNQGDWFASPALGACSLDDPMV